MIDVKIPDSLGQRSPGSYGEYATAMFGQTMFGVEKPQRFVDITVYDGKSYFLLNPNESSNLYSCLNFEDALVARDRVVPKDIKFIIMTHSSIEQVNKIERIWSRMGNGNSANYSAILSEIGIKFK